MTHSHLCFDLADCLEYNAYNDNDRRASECERAEVSAENYINDKRENSYNAEKEGADERYA